MQFDIHTHKKYEGQQSIFTNSTAICSNHPFSIGIHPWDLNEASMSKLDWSTLLNHSNCVAIGEIGLDRLRGPDLTKQIEEFKKQIEYAEQYEFPVIIHCVRTFEELIQLKRELNPRQHWIIHGFEKSTLTERLIQEGFYLSIGHRILTSEKLQGILPQIPLERLFLETDESDVSIDQMYETVAHHLNLPLLELENQIEENIKRVFPKWKIG